MNLTKYDVFFKVLETKTISQAAKELGYSQSAVSQTIKSLEEELESTLFIRQKSGVILSKDGHAYLPYLKSVQANLANLRTKKQEMKGLDQAILRIGTFTSISRHLLPSLMKEFIEMYPNVQFELYQSEYTNIEQQLLEGSLDLGFTCTDAIKEVQYEELYYDEMFAFVPQNHVLANYEVLSMEQIAKYPFIQLDEGEYSLPIKTFQNLGLHVQIKHKVYDDFTILAMIRQNLGISILYQNALSDYDDLCLIPIQENLFRHVGIAYNNYDTLSYAGKTIQISFLEKHQKFLKIKIAFILFKFNIVFILLRLTHLLIYIILFTYIKIYGR